MFHTFLLHNSDKFLTNRTCKEYNLVSMSLETQRQPAPEDADTGIAWQDSSDPTKYRLRKHAQILPPMREFSIGGLDLSVTPAEAPVVVEEGPEGITATVGNMPSSEDIIVPYLNLKVTQAEPPQTSPVLIEGSGKAIIIVGTGVRANADRPGRTRKNTVLYALPGADVKRPNPQAA